MNLLETVSVIILCWGIFSAPHQRKTSINSGGRTTSHTYLEQLDSQERDRSQKPAKVVEALALKPGLTMAALGSGSGYSTQRASRQPQCLTLSPNRLQT